MIALLALFIFSPFMLLLAVLVKLTSAGPVLFRQKRMGKGGQTFQIYKFRSMRQGESGPAVTKAGDSRLTVIGDFLRSSKLDELPQLINVVKGDMSLVGPRPKLPHHQTYTLEVRPGVTGAATLAFRNEEQLLYLVPEHALDGCQINFLMPLKRTLDDNYMAKASFFSDLTVLFRTAWRPRNSLRPQGMESLELSLVSLSQALGGRTAMQTPTAAPELSQRRFVLDKPLSSSIVDQSPPASQAADA